MRPRWCEVFCAPAAEQPTAPSESVAPPGEASGSTPELFSPLRLVDALVEALSPIMAFDVSLPIGEMQDYVAEVQARLEARWPQVRLAVFGHLGDGNLHLNIYTPGVFDKSTVVHEAIEPFVYEWIAERRGSISAEHGCGRLGPPASTNAPCTQPGRWLPLASSLRANTEPAPVDGCVPSAVHAEPRCFS